MARKDALHDSCKNALIKDGWTITDDPYILPRGTQRLFVDLAGERLVTAQRAGRKIAVEIKSLIGNKEMAEFERALGQFMLYRSLMKRFEPERRLYLAVARVANDAHFATQEGRALIEDEALRLIVFEPDIEEILEWIE